MVTAFLLQCQADGMATGKASIKKKRKTHRHLKLVVDGWGGWVWATDAIEPWPAKWIRCPRNYVKEATNTSELDKVMAEI